MQHIRPKLCGWDLDGAALALSQPSQAIRRVSLPCFFIYFDNTLIFVHATSHFPGPLCLQTTVLGTHTCAGEGGAGAGASICASSSWGCWQQGGRKGQVLFFWKVTEAMPSAQIICAPLLPSMLGGDVHFAGGLRPSAHTPADPKSNECLVLLPSLRWRRLFGAPVPGSAHAQAR